jgi:predicted Zn finger-like uncharacterized protein
MPIQAVCPECQSAYQLADQQRGKKVRCKNCETVFVVPDASERRTAVRAETKVSPPSPTRSNVKKAASSSPSSSRVRRGEDDEIETKSGSNALPWILGCGATAFGVFLLTCAGVSAYFFLREDKAPQVAKNDPPPILNNFDVQPQRLDQNLKQPPVNPPNQGQPNPGQPVVGQPVSGQPAPPPTNPPPPPKEPTPPPPAVDDKPVVRDRNRRLTDVERERVKHATVYLRVTMADGNRASGTGFFGSKDARNIILTNAHVVGMLSPESSRPRAIEVIVHSGEANEWKTTARVLGVDRSSDLAVLDIGTPTKPVPEPLTVKSASVLRELDEVYVFGFPLGEQLGKEITIRPSSVSSLRKKNGVLDRVQVNGGMDPGNSGGPVVDNTGDVVGVAVSGIPGRAINFAIPGDRVHTILDGRISTLTFQQPYLLDEKKLVVPAVVEMIDPRNLVKEVGLDIWTGNTPANPGAAIRPSSKTQPRAKPGDSDHLYYKLTYLAPEGKADLNLPELPSGKVYYQQPRWINAKGETRWASANLLRLPSQPVYRKPANLVLRYQQGATRELNLSIDNTFKVSDDDDSEAYRIHTEAVFKEKVEAANASGTRLSLRYKDRVLPRRDLIRGKESRPSVLLQQVKDDLPSMITLVQLDRVGNIIQQGLDQRPLIQMRQTNPQQFERLKEFHEMVQQGLESLSVSLPASGSAKPLDSWRAERNLPIDTPGKAESGKLDVTFTYLGLRKRDRRDEAVISMDGTVHGKSDAVNGRATGLILVDLATGQTLLADTTVKLQLDAVFSIPGEGERNLRVLNTIRFKMQRTSSNSASGGASAH